MKNKIKFLLIGISILILAIFTACEYDSTPMKQGYFTVKDFHFIDNSYDSISTISYDSVIYYLIPEIKDIYIGKNPFFNSVHAIDYYDDIKIIVLNDYSTDISANQNVNDFFLVNYHSPVEFRTGLTPYKSDNLITTLQTYKKKLYVCIARNNRR